MAVNDLRRTDVRTNVRINPFWIVSAEFGAVDTGDEAVLFGFPLVSGAYFIHEMLVDVTVAFDDADGVTGIGYGLLAAAGTIASGDPDNYMAAGEITANAIEKYLGGLVSHAHGTGNVAGTDWAEAKTAINTDGTGGTSLAGLRDQLIIGADYDSLPIVYATVKAAQTVGKARLHMMVSNLQ
jgi:hypothetical protein